MPKITITLTDERYSALTATTELHLPDGKPEDYLQKVVDSACDSYAQTFPAVSAEIYKQREATALAEKQAAEEKLAQLEAQLAASKANEPTE